ncbi:MAG: hypothetical protein WC390_10285 [Sulfurimonas sp.]|jgi:hypothetical protein
MCISQVSPITSEKKQHGFGWKVFRPEIYKHRCRRLRNPAVISDNRLVYGVAYGEFTLRQVGVWYRASKCKIKTAAGEEYMSGFHIFSNLKDAKAYSQGTLVIARVEYKGARTKGIQNSWISPGQYRTIVADYMKILQIYTSSGKTVWNGKNHNR